MTTPTGQNREPGWYPDGYGQMRWWDGQNWGELAPQQSASQMVGISGPKSRTTAGILGIFLGGWGVHNFYLGNTTRGIVQIAVTICTCGVGSLWGLIEGILILVRNPSFLTDANGVPLAD